MTNAIIEKCARAIDKALTKADKFGVPEREACQEAAKACLAALAEELDEEALEAARKAYEKNAIEPGFHYGLAQAIREYLQALTKGSGE